MMSCPVERTDLHVFPQLKDIDVSRLRQLIVGAPVLSGCRAVEGYQCSAFSRSRRNKSYGLQTSAQLFQRPRLAQIIKIAYR